MRKFLLVICIMFFLVLTISFAYTDTGVMLQSIDSCGELNTTNATYIVNVSSITATGNCFNITAHNITLNLNQTTITGNGFGNGIQIIGYKNITIINGFLTNFSNGFVQNHSLRLSILNLNISNSEYALYVVNSSKLNIINGSFSNLIYGIFQINSSYNNYTQLTITNITTASILISRGSHNLLSRNVINTINMVLAHGFYLDYSHSNKIINNTLSSNFSIYITWTNKTLIENNSINGDIILSRSNRNNLTNVNIFNSSTLLTVSSSNNNIVTNSLLNHSTLNGLYVLGSQFNSFLNLRFINNPVGIEFKNSQQNNFSFCNITDSSNGIHLWQNSTTNKINNVKITNSNLSFNVSNSDNNNLINNTFISSLLDFHIYNSSIIEYAFINSSIEFLNDFGKIRFHNSINTNGPNLSAVFVITNNSIFLNSSLDSNFNQSANISIYGFEMTSPYVRYDINDNGTFENCPNTICSKVTINSGNHFNVTHFTSYTLTDRGPISSCQNITISNSIYILTNSINNSINCFNITASNITFNLNNYLLNGSGISIEIHSNNVTIKNGIFNNYSKSLYVMNSANITLFNLTTYNVTYSVYIKNSSTNLIRNLAGTNNTYVSYIIDSSDTNFTYSEIQNSTYGLYFLNSSSNIVEFSNFINNNYSLVNVNSGIINAQYNFWNSIIIANITSQINGSASYDPWLTVQNPDITAPSFNVTPSSGTWSSSNTISFSIVSDDRILMKYRNKVASGSWSSYATCYAISDQDGDGTCASFSLSNNTYIFEFHAINKYGLTTLLNKTMTIAYTTPTTTQTTSSPGGTTTNSNPIIVMSKTWASLTGGAKYDIIKDNFYVTNVTFNVSQAIPVAKLTVRQVSNKPNVAQNVSGLVYRYFEFQKENLDSNIVSNVNIYFRIPKSWSTGVEVNFYRYYNNWDKLSSTKLRSDATYDYYIVKSPGFSYFAVSKPYTTTTTIATTTSTRYSSSSTLISSTTNYVTTTNLVDITTTTLIENDQEIVDYKPLNLTWLYAVLVLGVVITPIIFYREKILFPLKPIVIDLYGKLNDFFVKKDLKYKINDEEFNFKDLIEYIKLNSDKGFTYEKIESQLLKEGVPKKLITKALRKIN